MDNMVCRQNKTILYSLLHGRALFEHDNIMIPSLLSEKSKEMNNTEIEEELMET
jgi:hypothetical protein